MESPKKALHTDDHARLARIMRLVREKNWPGEWVVRLSETLTGEEAFSDHPSMQTLSVSGDHAREVVSRMSLTECERELRNLVDLDATWTELYPYARRLSTAYANLEQKAKLIELAFIHGDAESCVELLDEMLDASPNVFSYVHHRLRDKILVHLWQLQNHELISQIMKSVSQVKKTNVEHLYTYYRLMKIGERSEAFLYFQQYRDVLQVGIEIIGKQIGFSVDRYKYATGKLALEMGFQQTAQDFLKSIAPESDCYRGALALLDQSKVNPGQLIDETLYQQITSCEHWSERLEHIQEAFEQARRLGGVRDKQLPQLNDILSDPMSCIPAHVDAWRKLSEMISEYSDLYAALPNLFRMYREHTLNFLSPQLDQSIWDGPLYQMTSALPYEKYWRGIALLHTFVNSGPEAEECLWESRHLIESARIDSKVPLPFQWQQLQRSALQAVAKAPYLLERERDRMLLQLRVAASEGLLASTDVRAYLASNDHVHYRVLNALQKVVRKLDDRELEFLIIAKRAAGYPVTNSDLSCLWSLACCDGSSDLAWRTATVLSARGALHPTAKGSWQISGENRSEYPLQFVSKQDLPLLFSGFSQDEIRFIEVILSLGSGLSELLFYLDQDAESERYMPATGDCIEADFEKHLGKLRLFPIAKQSYRLGQDSSVHGGFCHLPFADVLPSNPWTSLFLIITQHLGVATWRWRTSFVVKQIEELVPRVSARQDLSKYSNKVVRWLRNLNGEQRSAWQDLLNVSRKIPDERAMDCIAVFAMRLATLIYPDHRSALQTLRTMRVPLPMIWGLESFLLSPEYSEWRQEKRISNVAPIPRMLMDIAISNYARK